MEKSTELLDTSLLQLKQYLYEINQFDEEAADKVSTFCVYQWFVAKEKAIYNVLNLMKPLGSNCVGLLWAPQD